MVLTILTIFSSDGQWDTEHPYTRTLGSATCPISKMHAVAGKLWCGSQNNICIVNPLTLKIEVSVFISLYISKKEHILFYL